MARKFYEIAFTPSVLREQEKHQSLGLYTRAAQAGDAGDRIGESERDLIETRDSFYMATASETGWPYIQFRGGSRGFLRVLDEKTLGFADLRGNRQYISTGNLHADNRVALFLMDYPSQSRLKILGRVEIHEDSAKADELIARLRVPSEKTPPERAFLIHVEAFDWNCQQHITPRYTQEELTQILEPMHHRMEAMEKELAELRAKGK
ncbi:MAG TPA: pyridoxamine 5'-phosphate oxidase family protein [Terracidiphilus sp.]|jgi:predicted pyridoxine 5'-phosphate oxidase superfamily flavin-nucleotide-binding protein|nr:pyridoxamine 5'-phosphate oxidase family protein [Terracidiphilus sp.]